MAALGQMSAVGSLIHMFPFHGKQEPTLKHTLFNISLHRAQRKVHWFQHLDDPGEERSRAHMAARMELKSANLASNTLLRSLKAAARSKAAPGP